MLQWPWGIVPTSGHQSYLPECITDIHCRQFTGYIREAVAGHITQQQQRASEVPQMKLCVSVDGMANNYLEALGRMGRPEVY